MSHFARTLPAAICALALGIAPAFASVDGNGATTPNGPSGPTSPSVDPTSGTHPSATPDQAAAAKAGDKPNKHKHTGQHHASPNQQNTSVTSGSPSSPNTSDTSGPPTSGAITHSGG
jgi:hypothetical protein